MHFWALYFIFFDLVLCCWHSAPVLANCQLAWHVSPLEYKLCIRWFFAKWPENLILCTWFHVLVFLLRITGAVCYFVLVDSGMWLPLYCMPVVQAEWLFQLRDLIIYNSWFRFSILSSSAVLNCLLLQSSLSVEPWNLLSRSLLPCYLCLLSVPYLTPVLPPSPTSMDLSTGYTTPGP